MGYFACPFVHALRGSSAQWLGGSTNKGFVRSATGYGNTGKKSVRSVCSAILLYVKLAVCPMGMYTPDCQSTCHCSGRQCNLMTGSCEDQPCIGGWTGENCDEGYLHPHCYFHSLFR